MENQQPNQNQLPPQGNLNMYPPPGIAFPTHCYGELPAPDLPPPQQQNHYNQALFVPIMAPPMQQLWSVEQQQQGIQMMQMQQQIQQMHHQMQQTQQQIHQQMQHQYQPNLSMKQHTQWNHDLSMTQMSPVMLQDPQLIMQQWPNGQQLTNADGQPDQPPQTQGGHLVRQNNNTVQQQVREPLMSRLEQNMTLMASKSQPQETPQEVQQVKLSQWNVNASEFVPRPMFNGGSFPTSTTSPPTELEDLAKEELKERLQDVSSLEASTSSVLAGERTVNVLDRSPLPVNSSSEESILVDQIDTRVSALTLENNAVLEDVTAETSNKNKPTTSEIQSELKQLHSSGKSQKKKRRDEKKLKEEAMKLSKSLKEGKEREDATALEEAFAVHSRHNTVKTDCKARLIEYVKLEKKRRREFQNNGLKLPSGTDVHWISADIYLYQQLPDTRTENSNERFYDKTMAEWIEISKTYADEASMTACYEAVGDFHDEVTNHDVVYLSEMMVAFPGYSNWLKSRMMRLLLNFATDPEHAPPFVMRGMEEASTIGKYLKRHAILRYTNGKVTDKLTPEEVETIAAFKNNRCDGMCILEAQHYFRVFGKFYSEHTERESKPFIKRNADVFRYLATIPSPILAFDAYFCLGEGPDLVSDTRYLITVMGNDEVPPYEE